MAKYKCPTLGDCDNANSGEVFERSPGDDVKCPKCDTPMELQAGGQVGPGGPNKKIAVAAVAGVLVLALGAGGYWYMQRPLKVAADLVEAAPALVETVKVAIDLGKNAALAPSDEETKALRIEGDQKLANGDAAGAETASSKAAANEMLKTAIARMAQGRLDEAEKELAEARLRDPHNVLVSYNVAILRLKQNRTDDALSEFEASFKDGFQYFDQMAQDRDLDTLRKDKRFQALLSRYQPQKS